MNKRQKLFCKEYIVDLNSTSAAIRAGYSEKTARQIGSKLLTKVDIQTEIQKMMNKRSEKVEIKAEDVLQEIKDLLSTDITDIAEITVQPKIERDDEGEIVYDDEGNPVIEYEQHIRIKDTSEMSKAALKSISEIGYNKYGVYIKRYDKQKTIELAGKHLKLFTDKVEHSGEIKLPTIKITK